MICDLTLDEMILAIDEESLGIASQPTEQWWALAGTPLVEFVYRKRNPTIRDAINRQVIHTMWMSYVVYPYRCFS